MRRSIVLLLVPVLGVTSCGNDDRVDAVTEADVVVAAETLCPVVWEWVKFVGDAFNDAAGDVASIDAPAARRRRWADALDRIEESTDQLGRNVGVHRDDPILGPLVAEIERDLPRSRAEIDEIRDLFRDSPEIDEGRHQDRTVQVIVRIEKVIDLPKPDLGELDLDGTLMAGFRRVPSCQHAIRDVDDGVARSND